MTSFLLVYYMGSFHHACVFVFRVFGHETKQLDLMNSGDNSLENDKLFICKSWDTFFCYSSRRLFYWLDILVCFVIFAVGQVVVLDVAKIPSAFAATGSAPSNILPY